MAVSENMLKWLLRFYPPLFFQRIWVQRFHKGFRGVNVKINKSLINRNPNNSIFGGTIFSAADPFLPVLFHHILKHDHKLRIWSKSAQINFLKPAFTDVFFEIKLTDDDILQAKQALYTAGVYARSFQVDIVDRRGEICVTVINEVYLRNLNFKTE